MKKIVPQALGAIVTQACNLAVKKTTSANSQEQWGNTTCQAAGAAAGAAGKAGTGAVGKADTGATTAFGTEEYSGAAEFMI